MVQCLIMSDPNDKSSQEPHSNSLTPWQMLSSTLLAAMGIQSSRNKERDFSKGKPLHFIAAGVIFTLAFILIIAWVVSQVLSSAQQG